LQLISWSRCRFTEAMNLCLAGQVGVGGHAKQTLFTNLLYLKLPDQLYIKLINQSSFWVINKHANENTSCTIDCVSRTNGNAVFVALL